MKRIFGNILRTAVALFAIIMFGFFVFPMTMGIINIGNISGALLCVWIFCVSVKPLHKLLRRFFCKWFLTRWLYRVVNFCFAVFIIYGAIVTGAMVYCSSQAPTENATAVILGAQVKNSGPSVMLWGRINAADKYLEENPEASAVLTGGQGSDEPVSEAQAMFEVLKDKGIEPKRLYLEDKATNTTENLKYSMKIIDDYDLNGDIAVATDGFHQLRVRIIARQLGIKGNVGAVNSDTSFRYLPTFIVREWFALPYQLLFR